MTQDPKQRRASQFALLACCLLLLTMNLILLFGTLQRGARIDARDRQIEELRQRVDAIYAKAAASEAAATGHRPAPEESPGAAAP